MKINSFYKQKHENIIILIRLCKFVNGFVNANQLMEGHLKLRLQSLLKIFGFLDLRHLSSLAAEFLCLAEYPNQKFTAPGNSIARF